MFTLAQLKKFSVFAYQNYLNHVSIDCVVFGFSEGQLKVLILQINDGEIHFLPGGFILNEEHIDVAANRILKKTTGLDQIFLQQFRIFGEPERAKDDYSIYNDALPINENWFANRFLTIGYYALVDYNNLPPMPDELAQKCTWHDLTDMPDLKFDHGQVLKTALDALRQQLNYQPIGYNLMPKVFTMPELQKLYETILDKKLAGVIFSGGCLALGS